MGKYRRVVAHIHDSFFAKSETFIYNYISNLKNFRPICLAREFANLDQFPFPKDDLYCLSLNRHSFRCIYHEILRRCFGRDLLAEDIIKTRKAQLIHAHFGPNGFYALKLRRRLGIPLITTFYGYDMSRLSKQAKWKRYYNTLFQESDLCLVEGTYMKSRLCDLGCPEDKVKIQRIAIPLERIPFRCRKPKKRGKKVILVFSGRFVEKKGLIYALKAIRKIRKENKKFEFRIIGDGPLRPIIEEFVDTHQMQDYVRMLGFLNYQNYLDEMQKGDIFVQPSVTASNGSSEGGAPTTILEAQAVGMPIVSTYHADIPNVVVPGKSALLSNERDWVTFAQNIVSLLENQETWEQMGHIGREFVESHHNITKEVNELEEKYDFLLQST